MESLALVIIASSIIHDVVISFLGFIIVSFAFGNRSLLKFRVILTAIFIFLGASVWKVFGILEYFTDSAAPPPFGYNVPPYLYNILSQFLFPGVMVGVSLFFLLVRSKYKHAFLSAFIMLCVVLPWAKLIQIISVDEFATTNKYVSRQQMADFEKTISSKIINEEIIYDSANQTKTLRIKTLITVPRRGYYQIPLDYETGRNNVGAYIPRYLLDPLTPASYTGANFKGFDFPAHSYFIVFMNGQLIEPNGLQLNKGDNTVNFDFPVIYTDSVYVANSGIRLEKRVNRFFIDGVDGIYGPYSFQFSINSYRDSANQILRFSYLSPAYQTKIYSVEDLR